MTLRDSVPELSVLRSGPVGVATAEEIEAERQVIVPWLEEQIAALPYRRQMHLARRRRHGVWMAVAGGVFAAAAAALVVIQWSSHSDGAPAAENASENYATLLSGRVLSGSVEILPGSRLGEASVVRSAAEEPALLRGNNYLARLSPGGELALGVPGADPSRQELRLTRGQVHLSVQRLAQGKTLSVLAEDARVVVRGTEFSVALKEQGELVRACVRVTEGAVEVHRRGVDTVLLGAEEQSGCDEPTESPAEVEASGEDEPPAISARRSVPSEPPSTLKQETGLLASALAAERAGNLPRARRELRAFLKRYPQSPMAEEARAALARVTANASR